MVPTENCCLKYLNIEYKIKQLLKLNLNAITIQIYLKFDFNSSVGQNIFILQEN